MDAPSTPSHTDHQPLVHFAGPWTPEETDRVEAAAEGTDCDMPSEFGRTWVAVKHVFPSFVLYVASRHCSRGTLTAQHLTALVEQMRRVGAAAPPDAAMFQLVYQSEARTPMDTTALHDLLHQARANNQRLGITGVLLYKAGGFIQVLEGDEETVRALYATIRDDPRHEQVETLLTAQITERIFPDWTMGLEDLDRVVEGGESVNTFLQDGHMPGLQRALPAVCQALEAFKARAVHAPDC